jgi:glutathione peroxidase|tara:strand:- start:294 stop:833 length:540 start_codon:yes stop_codon:yes gene_type:complete
MKNLLAFILAISICGYSTQSVGEVSNISFPSIYVGKIETQQWAGKPYLVVNTASMCAFTRQYVSLQKLYDNYREAGFGMVAVPLDDFNQELSSYAEIKDFCELNYDINMPMSETLSVKEASAHSFFKAVEAEVGFVPSWNFNKVLIGVDGDVVGTGRSLTALMSRSVIKAIEAELAKME